MNIEMIMKRIDEMENQISSVKKAITGQNVKLTQIEDKASGFLEMAKVQNNDITKLNSLISGIGQFDIEISKLRVDINRQIEEAEKRIQLNQKVYEKLRMDELNSLNSVIDKVKKDLILSTEQKNKMLVDEDSRLVSRINEVDDKIHQKIHSDEDIKVNLSQLQQEIQQNKRALTVMASENGVFKKRNDEFRARLEILTRDLKVYDSRMNEIIATENERKQSYITFIDQQSLNKNDRDRVWADWTTQFEESIKEVYKLIPELQSQQNEMKKTKSQFEQITNNFDRRTNELTEMYRLMDEKFRKEWATFKTDMEKRWSNVSLILEDKQGGSEEKVIHLNERLIEVEDETQEMQEALILMSREIQKGMQSLMNMVNGWLDAFGQIRSR
jgi:DNA repair exonuclease SbcCD ATPase subunit